MQRCVDKEEEYIEGDKGLSRRKCPVFQNNKTKNFDHYMDYY